jgi:hypothetical protein
MDKKYETFRSQAICRDTLKELLEGFTERHNKYVARMTQIEEKAISTAKEFDIMKKQLFELTIKAENLKDSDKSNK